MAGRASRQIEVAGAIWQEVPAHQIENAIDALEDPVCAACRCTIDLRGEQPAALRAYIEPGGRATLVLVHRKCGDSRVVHAEATDHPEQSVDAPAPMRWRAELRLHQPGALLLWDDPSIGEPGGQFEILPDVLTGLGFTVVVGEPATMVPPVTDLIEAQISGDDLRLLVTEVDVPDLELQTFPAIAGGPWIEQAKLDKQIVVLCGSLHLGQSALGFSDDALRREVVGATIPFSR